MKAGRPAVRQGLGGPVTRSRPVKRPGRGRATNIRLESAVEGVQARHGWDIPKVRACLVCRTCFESQWSGERICHPCKSKKSWRSAIPG